MAQIGSLFASLTLQNASFDSGIKRSTRNVQQAEREMASSFGGMVKNSDNAFKKMAGAAAGLGVAAGLTGLLTKIGQVNVEYQKLQGMLFTATGSQAAANREMAELQKFAATTPFALNQVTEAFVKLKNLGLDPSMEALKSYGNTASSMGKDVMQFIEAVADAATGEFERLKEFGIKASKEGDKVSLTFRGTKTTIANDAGAIQGYLKAIGDTQFAGAMDRQAATLGGAFSNLGDTLAQLAVKFGEAGFGPALESATRAITESSGSMEKFATDLGFLTGEVLGTAVNGFVMLAENVDTLVTALEIASTVMIGRFAASLAATSAGAIAQFIRANSLAVASALAWGSVAPAAATAGVAFSGLRAAASGLLAVVGGPLGAAFMALTYEVYEFVQANQTGKAEIANLSRTVSDANAALIEATNRAKEAGVGVDVLNKAANSAGPVMDAVASAYAKAAGQAANLAAQARNAAIEVARGKITELQAQKSKVELRRGGGLANNFVRGSQVWGGWLGLGPTIQERNNGAAALQRQIDKWTGTQKILEATPESAFKPAPTPRVTPSTSPGSSHKSSGGSSGQDPLKAAKDMVEQLKFMELQLGRTNEEQEVYNNLKQAGVAIDSEYGKQIAEATRKNQSVEAIKKNKDALDEQLKSLKEQSEEIGLNDRALAMLNLQREHAARITKGLTEGEDDYYKALQASTNAIFDKRDAQEDVNKFLDDLGQKQADTAEQTKRGTEQFGRNLTGIGIRAFDDLIHGSKSFGEAFKGIISDIGDLMLEKLVYKPLAEMGANLLGGIANNLLTSIGISIPGVGATGKPAAVGKASGGPVQGGREYWVGEHGPERFVAPTNGRIIPHDAPRGGNISISIDARGSTNEAATRTLVLEGIATAMPQIKSAAHAYTMEKAGRLRM